MILIVGLGNPGDEYKNTRHNVGFMLIDELILGGGFDAVGSLSKFKGELYKKGSLLLLKPQTFMNLSGKAVMAVKNFYKLDNSDILVIYDDVSMPVGQLRVRTKGSPGGHNGIKDILLSINSDEFPRIKMGVGAPPDSQYDLADYVLGKFTDDDIKLLSKAAEKIEENLELAVKRDYNALMGKLNVRI